VWCETEAMVAQLSFGDFRTDFHPIDDLLNSESWLRDDATSKTDDDELLVEMGMLSSAEKEISQEISRLDIVNFFRENYRTTSCNKQMPTKVKGKKKTHANISNIQDLDVQMIERDARDSPNKSFPSDEAYNGIDDISERDPPEEHNFVDGVEYDYSNTLKEVVLHLSTSNGDDIEKSTENSNDSLHYEDEINIASNFLEKRNKEEDDRSVVLSEWNLNSIQISDLEKGENNIFEEETFWNDGLWKTPLNKTTSHNTTIVRSFEKEYQNKAKMSERSNSQPVSKTRSRFIEMLSLPILDDLDDRRIGKDNKNGKSTSIVSPQFWESRPRKVTEENQKLENTERTHTQSTRMMIMHGMDEDDMSISTHGQHKISDGKQGLNENKASRYRRCYAWCNLRIFIVSVHIILIVIGIIMFYRFLFQNNSLIRQPYAYETPGNNNCSVAVNNQQPLESITTYGTTLGATRENDLCNTSLDHVGVWYTVTGTGGYMVVSIQTESEINIHSSILYGQCDDLICISSSGGSKVTWLSVAGESYHILIHGESPSNFLLSLYESTLSNSECEAFPSLLSSNYTGTSSIVGTTETPVTENELPICGDIVPEIGSVTWYSIKGNGNIFSVSICGYLDSLNKEIYLQLFSGRCDDLTCFPMKNGLGFATVGSEKEVWLSVPEEIYYISIWSSIKEKIKFTLCLDQSEAG